uniref:Shikimate dehydrogenase n=1 Tax=Corethron hystrix TaxID=216773 RepID=A0A7S1BTH9_9STRA
MSSSTASPPSLTTPKNQSSGGGDDDDDAPSSPFRSSPVVLVGFSHGDGRLQKLASAYSERTSGSVVISPDSGGIRDISVIDLDADPSREIPIYSTSPDGSRPLLVYASSAEDDEAFLVRLSGVTSHEVAISGDMVWEDMAWLLDRLSTHARNPGVAVGGEGARRTMGPHTFFLSLSFGDVNEAAEYMGAMCGDTDVMEFRMDLIKNQNRHHIVQQVQDLRLMSRPHAARSPLLASSISLLTDAIPILYTVRTANQAGTFPDATENDIQRMYDFAALGFRTGSEVVDIESAWDQTPDTAKRRKAILESAEEDYGSTLLLGSHHVVAKKVSDEEALQLFHKCALGGKAHGAKVVLSVDDAADAGMADVAGRKFTENYATEHEGTIITPVGLVLGDVGRQSRILNTYFTPVTHEALPFKAAPGQLSANEIMKERVEQGMISPKRFCILGHNIAYSVSPAMQGAAFKTVGLPHSYVIEDYEEVLDFVKGELFLGNNFGGASVTIPHKQNILPYIDEVSYAVKIIGSMNTIIVKDGEGDSKRKLYGDNTDWKGIYNPLKRRLPNKSSVGRFALIIGAGGTARAAAYAARELGLSLVYQNRTPSKAADLAATFGGSIVSSLDDEQLTEVDIDVVISTLPASVGVTLPEHIVKSYPIIFDVNYKPFSTPLLEQALLHGCNVVRGSEMLWEQGVGQFEAWTGRTAPYGVMRDAVLKNCLPTE